MDGHRRGSVFGRSNSCSIDCLQRWVRHNDANRRSDSALTNHALPPMIAQVRFSSTVWALYPCAFFRDCRLIISSVAGERTVGRCVRASDASLQVRLFRGFEHLLFTECSSFAEDL